MDAIRGGNPTTPALIDAQQKQIDAQQKLIDAENEKKTKLQELRQFQSSFYTHMFDTIKHIATIMETDVEAIVAHVPQIMKESITFYNFDLMHEISYSIIDKVSKATYLGLSSNNQVDWKNTIYDLLGEALLSNNNEYHGFQYKKAIAKEAAITEKNSIQFFFAKFIQVSTALKRHKQYQEFQISE